MKVAMVTGANSGLGLETARQLGHDASFGTIFLACRSQAKGDAAKATLVERFGCSADKFAVLVVDVSSVDSTRAAISALREQQPQLQLDFVVLNAGQVGSPTLQYSPDGVEISYAASLTGHYVMTMSMLKGGMLRPGAAVVISGAEAARGTLPGMSLYDVRALSEAHHGGDLVQTMSAMARGELPGRYDARNNLATLKAFAHWWGAALARRLQDSAVPVRVFTVSPGGTPGTNGTRNLPFAMRTFIRLATPLFKLAGQAHSVEAGAARYLEMIDRPAADSGKFFASAADKNVGPLIDNTPLFAHFHDRGLQDAALATLAALTNEAPVSVSGA